MRRKLISSAPRWVEQGTDEAKKIDRQRCFMDKYAWKSCRVFFSADRAPIVGYLHGSLSQPRFSEGCEWQYRGSIWLDTDDRSMEVDFLEVDRAEIV